MAIAMTYDLDLEISRLIRADGVSDNRADFKRGLQKHIESRQKKIAMMVLERIYNDDRIALSHDMELEKMEKILVMIKKDMPVGEIERKKMLAILYPLLKQRFSSFLQRWAG